MKERMRYLLSNRDVVHGFHGETCFCGAPAKHEVDTHFGRSIHLCSQHFGQMFRLPDVRQRPKRKKKVVPVFDEWAERQIVLRQPIDPPIFFTGRKLAEQSFLHQKERFFLTVYGQTVSPNAVFVSITCMMENKDGTLKTKTVAHYVERASDLTGIPEIFRRYVEGIEPAGTDARARGKFFYLHRKFARYTREIYRDLGMFVDGDGMKKEGTV